MRGQSNQHYEVPAAVLAGRQALLKVLHQGRNGEGVRLGMVGDPSAAGQGLLLIGLLPMLKVLVCTLCKYTHHLTMHLFHIARPYQYRHTEKCKYSVHSSLQSMRIAVMPSAKAI